MSVWPKPPASITHTELVGLLNEKLPILEQRATSQTAGPGLLTRFINVVEDHGAVSSAQNGAAPATNSGPAIDAALDAMWSAGDHTAVSRYALKPVYIPAGRYRVDGWLRKMRGGQGAALFGAGMGQTVLEFYSNPVVTGNVTSSTASVTTTDLTTTANHEGRFFRITAGTGAGQQLPVASNTMGANAQFTLGCAWTAVSGYVTPDATSDFEVVDPCMIEMSGLRGAFMKGITFQPASGSYLYGAWNVWRRNTTFPSSPDRTATSSNENVVEECEVLASTANVLRKVGFAAGYEGNPGAGDQVDSVVWRRCRAFGTYDVSQADQTTHTQIAFQAGGGSFGNPVIFTMDNCIASGFRTLVMCNAADLRIEGGTLQSCRYVIGHNGVQNYLSVSDIRAELCGYLLKSINSFEVSAGTTLRNIEFKLDSGYYDPDSTGNLIDYQVAAPLVIENVKLTNALPSGKRAYIYAPGAGQQGSGTPAVIINGYTTPEHPGGSLTGIFHASGWRVYRQAATPAANITEVVYAPFTYVTSGISDRAAQVWMSGSSIADVRLNRAGAGMLGVAGQIVTGSKGVRVQKLGTPGAPQLSGSYTAGATTYRYRFVCKDAHGRKSAAGTTANITDGPATLNITNYVWIREPSGGFPVGTCSVDVLKESPTGSGTYVSLFLDKPVDEYLWNDYGQATSAYTLPTADATGGIVSAEPHALTYGATIATDASLSNDYTIDVTNGTAFTISNPTSTSTGQRLTYSIKNNSGGAMGAITWGSEFKLAGAFTNPANGNRRTITFCRETATEWVERARSMADIA